MKTIPLTKGFFAKVDDADYEDLIKFKWHATVMRRTGRAYARRSFSRSELRYHFGKNILMHRQILKVPRSHKVDHRDTDSLNNQRGNLRLASVQQNTANIPKQPGKTSRYKGVSFIKALKKWRAGIQKRRIGDFREECDAATAYNFAAEEAFGEFANMNLPIAAMQAEQAKGVR